MKGLMLVDELMPWLRKHAYGSQEVFVCTASCTKKALEELAAEYQHCKKRTIVFGMFSWRGLAVDLPKHAHKLGWRVGVSSNLHAKLFVVRSSKGWVVLLGSSNIADSEHEELNIELSFRALPDELADIMRRYERHLKTPQELAQRKPHITLHIAPKPERR